MASSRRPGTNESRWTGSAWEAGVNTYGSGKDYTALGTWEADTDQDLVTATVSAVLECYRGVYDDGCALVGDTASSSYFRTIRAASGHRHNGVPGAGVLFVPTVAANAFSDAAADNYYHFHDLEVRHITNNAGSYSCLGMLGSYHEYVGLLLTENNSGAGSGAGIWDEGTTSVIVNCIAYDTDGVGFTSKNGTVYNCTTHTCSSSGYSYFTTNNTYKNCAAQNGTSWSGAGTSGSTHNLASDDNAPEYGVYWDAKTLAFRAPAMDWYWLNAGDNDAIDRGTDLSADSVFPFDDDIAGNLRTPGSWDIGAHEWQSESSRRRGINEHISTFGATGFGRDYTSLGTWEADTDNDLVAAATSEVVECYRDALSYALAPTFGFSNATASLAFSRTVRAASGQAHLGVPGAGVKFSLTGTNQQGSALDYEAYFAWHDCEITYEANTASNAAVIYIETGQTGHRLIGLLVTCSNSGAGGADGVYLYYAASSHTITLANCAAYDCDRVGFRARVIGGTCAVFNCTAHGCGTGFLDDQMSGIDWKNCVGYGNTTDFYGSASSGATHNLSSDATAPGAVNYQNKTLTFTDAANHVYGLAATDTDAIGMGTDLSADAVFAFDDDIAGVTRTTWDVGAFAYVSSATGQFARPASDVSDGNWLNESASNVNLYASIDEVTASDADYIRSPAGPVDESCTIGLSSLTTPAAGTVTIRIRGRFL